MKITVELAGCGYFALKEGKWLSLKLTGPVEMSGQEAQEAGVESKGTAKIEYKAELGVADLEAGEQPRANTGQYEGPDNSAEVEKKE